MVAVRYWDKLFNFTMNPGVFAVKKVCRSYDIRNRRQTSRKFIKLLSKTSVVLTKCFWIEVFIVLYILLSHIESKNYSFFNFESLLKIHLQHLMQKKMVIIVVRVVRERMTKMTSRR